MWCEISQAVDLMQALRARGLSLVDALSLLDSGPAMRFSVRFGRTGWSTGDRLFYECEVGAAQNASVTALSGNLTVPCCMLACALSCRAPALKVADALLAGCYIFIHCNQSGRTGDG